MNMLLNFLFIILIASHSKFDTSTIDTELKKQIKNEDTIKEIEASIPKPDQPASGSFWNVPTNVNSNVQSNPESVQDAQDKQQAQIKENENDRKVRNEMQNESKEIAAQYRKLQKDANNANAKDIQNEAHSTEKDVTSKLTNQAKDSVVKYKTKAHKNIEHYKNINNNPLYADFEAKYKAVVPEKDVQYINQGDAQAAKYEKAQYNQENNVQYGNNQKFDNQVNDNQQFTNGQSVEYGNQQKYIPQENSNTNGFPDEAEKYQNYQQTQNGQESHYVPMLAVQHDFGTQPKVQVNQQTVQESNTQKNDVASENFALESEQFDLPFLTCVSFSMFATILITFFYQCGRKMRTGNIEEFRHLLGSREVRYDFDEKDLIAA